MSTTNNIVLQEQVVTTTSARVTIAIMRIVIGWVFFWAFIDKLFGLGYSTPSERSWLNGGKPAQGFLMGTTGEDATSPFVGLGKFFLSWGAFADILFMAALLLIGVAFLLGAGLKIAAWGGTLLMLFMYLVLFPGPGATNPVTDSHWIEALALLVPAYTLGGDTWGVGKIWAKMIGDNTWLR